MSEYTWIYWTAGFGTALGLTDRTIAGQDISELSPLHIVWLFILCMFFWPAVLAYHLVRWTGK